MTFLSIVTFIGKALFVECINEFLRYALYAIWYNLWPQQVLLSHANFYFDWFLNIQEKILIMILLYLRYSPPIVILCKTGLSIADVVCNGHIEKRKTFFPNSWSREEVVSKLIEASQNPTKTPLIEGSKCVFFGKTSGIIIKFVIDIPSGNYITAYPDARANGLV